MNDLVANTIAMACYLNARVRGISCTPICENEVVFKFDRVVEFWNAKPKLLSKKFKLGLVSTDPDEWIDDQIERGTSRASLAYTPSPRSIREDRKTAAFVGGGGQFLLVIQRKSAAEFWHSTKEVEDMDHPDRKIWKTRFFLASSQPEPPPKQRGIASVSSDLRDALVAIHGFAVEQHIDGFAKTFEQAIERLDADDPLAGSYYRSVIPEGLLSLDAQRLFGAAELPFVFGGMGSWSDGGFRGESQVKHEVLSDRLFELSNEAVCAAVNDTSAAM